MGWCLTRELGGVTQLLLRATGDSFSLSLISHRLKRRPESTKCRAGLKPSPYWISQIYKRTAAPFVRGYDGRHYLLPGYYTINLPAIGCTVSLLQ
jgi:hypothetical protein